ncbi:uncharacterized protein LOC131929507 isoform X2 [Physella acuta]|uniref:uncharacterized protein LOC131929507 isoform X2 n=1 Tax=Physella acuta TaxID=109671 RepID=UPI0027DC567B|nr:uncharacterized protein LOC131929507 isoform X2 [Physella acuta]
MSYSFKILSGFLLLVSAASVMSDCVVYTKVFQFVGQNITNSSQACQDYCVSLTKCISYLLYDGECVVAEVGVDAAVDTNGTGYVVCDEILPSTQNISSNTTSPTGECVVYSKVLQHLGPDSSKSIQGCQDLCVSLSTCISYVFYLGECVVSEVGVDGAMETNGFGYVVCDAIRPTTALTTTGSTTRRTPKHHHCKHRKQN